MNEDLSYMKTEYARQKMIESYDIEAKEREKNGVVNMEITKGQCVKVTTTKDQCIRLTIDIEKAFVGKANLLDWQDKMITLQYEGEDGAHS